LITTLNKRPFISNVIKREPTTKKQILTKEKRRKQTKTKNLRKTAKNKFKDKKE